MRFDHYTYQGDPNLEEDAFCQEFYNRALEVPAQYIFHSLVEMADEREAYIHLQDGFQTIVTELDEAIALGEFVQKLRDRQYLAKQFRITNPADYQRIHWELEKAFIFKMHQLERLDFYMSKEAMDFLPARWVRLRWQEILDDVPTIDNASGTDELKISDEELQHIIKEVKQFRKRVQKDFVPTKDEMVCKYIRRVHLVGIELNNEVYRELYECFEYFRLIPDEIISSHEARPNGYVRENYIKQKFNRIKQRYARTQKGVSNKG